MEHEAVHDLTPAYALDALDSDEMRVYEAHLASCERCRHELGAFSEVAGALALAVEPAEPPPELRRRILEGARAERPNVVPLKPRWAYPAAATAAAAVAAAIGLGTWALILHGQLGRSQALRTLPLSGAAGSVVVGDKGNAALVVSDLASPPKGKTYEAWVIEGGRAHPAGLFLGRKGTVAIRLLHTVPRGGFTVERAGGANRPTRQPIIISAPAS
jgi:anti-sigma-K factor RskA